MKKDSEQLKAIARASIRHCPEIIIARVAVRKADGFEYSVGGSIPWPSNIENRGFIYRDPRNNTTFGKRHPSEYAARLSWKYQQQKNAVEFLRKLRNMSSSRVKEQADFWLKSALAS